MAGSKPGDVGVWNSHFRVGGAAGTTVRNENVTSANSARAAWGHLHLTDTSSAYVENVWGWTADHDLDGGWGNSVISVGRGALIEATKGTWLLGTAMEHNTLYQYNYHNAANVASIFQQSETPYWQGPGNDAAPQPWSANLVSSDPTFASCAQSGSGQCGMALFETITNSSNISLYGGCVWVFFNNGVGQGDCATAGVCQQTGIEITNSHQTYIYGTNMHSVDQLISSGGSADTATQAINFVGLFGQSGGVVAGYFLP